MADNDKSFTTIDRIEPQPAIDQLTSRLCDKNIIARIADQDVIARLGRAEDSPDDVISDAADQRIGTFAALQRISPHASGIHRVWTDSLSA